MVKSFNNSISVIGVGKLGLCLALLLSHSNFKVYGHDKNKKYLDSLKKKNFKSSEPGVNNYLQKTNLVFCNNLDETINKSKIIFITVKTYGSKNGSYNTTQLMNLAKQIKRKGINLQKKIIVISCNVNIGDTEKFSKILNLNKKNNLVYNPEWIAQGSIINDFKNPDSVIIGTENKSHFNLISSIYKAMVKSQPSFFKMKVEEAELVKIALNSFLALKITYANLIGDIALKLNLDPNIILKSVGNDKRVGKHFFDYGFGYGGPCLPRDVDALIFLLKEKKVNYKLISSLKNYNNTHLKNYSNFLLKKNKNKKHILFKYLSYKPNVEIFENSEQLKTAKLLLKKDIKIKLIRAIDKKLINL